jgi:hypothetical protein
MNGVHGLFLLLCFATPLCPQVRRSHSMDERRTPWLSDGQGAACRALRLELDGMLCRRRA